MRVVLDTNIIVSGLISDGGSPARLLDAWTDKVFLLISSPAQIAEINEVTRRPSVRPLLTPSHAGRFVNDLSRFATLFERLPDVNRSTDPKDNYLLGMAEAGAADYLVTGDKRDVLALERHGSTQIVTANVMLSILGIKS